MWPFGVSGVIFKGILIAFKIKSLGAQGAN